MSSELLDEPMSVPVGSKDEAGSEAEADSVDEEFTEEELLVEEISIDGMCGVY
jgi:mycofactocin precursor